MHYRLTGLKERLRALGRGVDFLCLLSLLRARGAIRGTRRYVLVELGPGPTRLAALKRALFSSIIFVDFRDYGIPDPSLRIVDLEALASGSLASIVGTALDDVSVLVFADHCLEHLSDEAATRFFDEIARRPRWACCARVPNVLSAGGRRNFLADDTHRTSFDAEMRERLRGMGFRTSTWFRFYRIRPMLEALSRRSALLGSDEVAFIKTSVVATSESSARR